MTTIITQRPDSPHLTKIQINNIIMFMVAIGIAAMTIATQPFNSAAPRDQIDDAPSPVGVEAHATPPMAEWCCLGARPAEMAGRGMTDVSDVTSSVDNNPRLNLLAVRSVGLDPGAIDRLIGGTTYPVRRHALSSNNHMR